MWLKALLTDKHALYTPTMRACHTMHVSTAYSLISGQSLYANYQYSIREFGSGGGRREVICLVLSSCFSNTVAFPPLLDAITVYKPSCSIFSCSKQFRLSNVNNSVSKSMVVVQLMISLSGGLMNWIVTM